MHPLAQRARLGYLERIAEVRVCKRVAVKIGHRRASLISLFCVEEILCSHRVGGAGAGRFTSTEPPCLFALPLCSLVDPPSDGGEPLGLAC